MIRPPKCFKTKHLESSGFPNALKQSRLPKCFKTKHVECSGLPNALKQSIWRAQASQMLQNKAAGAKQNTAGSVLAADEKPPLVCLAPNLHGRWCLAPNQSLPLVCWRQTKAAAGVSGAKQYTAGVVWSQTNHSRWCVGDTQ